MDVIGTVLTLAVIGLLWVAAVLFGRDTREPEDWGSRTNFRDHAARLGE